MRSPISPSPTFAWRSRLEPSSICESLMCSALSRSRPIVPSSSSSIGIDRGDVADVDARAVEVRGVEADAEPGVAAAAVDHGRQLGDRAAHRPARAGGVLEQQPGAVAGQLEHALEHGRGALEARVEAAAEVRAEVHDHGQRPESATRAQGLREHGLRALHRELIRAGEVDQVRRVADGDEAGLGRQIAEAREILVRVHGRLPHARALREHLQRAAAEVRRPPDRLVDPAGARDMGSEQHGEKPIRAPPGSPRGRPDRRLESRLESGPWPALSARGLRRPQPVCSTWAAYARPSSRGSTRATTAAASCCASRTPTRRASTPRRSSRSSARCAGSGSSGTRARASAATTRPTCRASAARVTTRSPRRSSRRVARTAATARPRSSRPSARRRSARDGRSSTRAAASR